MINTEENILDRMWCVFNTNIGIFFYIAAKISDGRVYLQISRHRESGNYRIHKQDDASFFGTLGTFCRQSRGGRVRIYIPAKRRRLSDGRMELQSFKSKDISVSDLRERLSWENQNKLHSNVKLHRLIIYESATKGLGNLF